MRARQVYIVYPSLMNQKTWFKTFWWMATKVFRAPSRMMCPSASFTAKWLPMPGVWNDPLPKVETKIMVATTVIGLAWMCPMHLLWLLKVRNGSAHRNRTQLVRRVGRVRNTVLYFDDELQVGRRFQNTQKPWCAPTMGFEIAETDLKLRGPGDLMGTQQSGSLWFKNCRFSKGCHVLQNAREAAQQNSIGRSPIWPIPPTCP